MFDKLNDYLLKEIIKVIPENKRLLIGICTFILSSLWILFWNWDEDKTKKFVTPFTDSIEINFYTTPKPIPGQFNVALAKLKNDESDATRQELVKNLQNFASKFNELGTKESHSINVVRVPVKIGFENDTDLSARHKGHLLAHQFLKNHGYDVLIWGFASKSGQSLPTLFWTTLAHEDPYHHIDASNSEEKLPAIAIKDLTTVLQALISTKSFIFGNQKGQYVADRLRPFVKELKSLIETSGEKPNWNPIALWQIKIALANSLSQLGEQAGQNEPLLEAINYYQEFLKSTTSHNDPSEWARVQSNLEGALTILSMRDPLYIGKLEESIKANREASLESPKDKNPLDWAISKNNRGLTLATLRSNPDEAIKTFNDALQVCTKEEYPIRWATLQNNLGIALMQQFEVSDLNNAIKAYQAALTILTKIRFPLDYAVTQDNLGFALRRLGTLQHDTLRLKQAIEAHNQALTVWTKDENPWDWAIAKNNLGETFIKLSEKESKLEYLEEANQAFIDALTVRTQENFPWAWAATLNDWGIVLSKIGERKFDTVYLEQAIMAFRAASTIRTKEEYLKEWDSTQNNLKKALTLLDRAELMNDCNNVANSIYYSVLPEMLSSSDTERFNSKIWQDKLNRKIKSGSKKCKNHLQFDVAR
jgi:tetratricopeptide (TPR) repeat protein